jgi:YgiT-type zinc finger domain-containing protein
MRKGFENKEASPMKCHVCGSQMRTMITDIPFKINPGTIVILKYLPVLQCDSCKEFILDDSVMERVEKILDRVDTAAELEVVKYAA